MTGAPTPEAWQAIRLTLQLATLTALLLLLIATPLAWWLSQTRSRWRAPVSALVTLPLVLPPTVLGFYLLLLLGPRGPLAPLLQSLDLRLVFSFTGLRYNVALARLNEATGTILDEFDVQITEGAVPNGEALTFTSK